jgi:uncharacterized protein
MLSNQLLLLPFALPYLAYVGIASLPSEVLSREASYGLRLVVVGTLMIWAWRWYPSLRGRGRVLVSIAWGLAAGVCGTVLWVGLLSPFVSHSPGEPWTLTAIALRLVAAGCLVPVFEELMMRCFVFRLALQWDQQRLHGSPAPLETALAECSLHEVQPGEWSWAAVFISSLAFAAGHAIVEWPAAVAYGLLMCGLWVARKDLVSCVAAHAATNITLAGYVMVSGNWQYW